MDTSHPAAALKVKQSDGRNLGIFQLLMTETSMLLVVE